MTAMTARAAGVGDVLDACLSVQSLGVFKPARPVYGLVGEYFGCASREVLFVSSNCWDACAAAGFGFTAVWANRASEPMDRWSQDVAEVWDRLFADLPVAPTRSRAAPGTT